jgi:esterase/lipase
MAEAPVKTKPETIVLIHGFWVTLRSWEHWKQYYEAKGYTVLKPAYPGFEVEVEALRADPTPIEQLEVPEIIDMLENLIGKLDRSPIIIGHSAGGVFTQILLDHGFGAVGVAVDSAADRGREGRSALRDQVRVPHPEESRESASGGRFHAETVALRVREHIQRREVT